MSETPRETNQSPEIQKPNLELWFLNDQDAETNYIMKRIKRDTDS